MSITLVRLAYSAQDEEVAGKALDFPGPTIARRRSAGYEARTGFAEGANASLIIGALGLAVSSC